MAGLKLHRLVDRLIQRFVVARRPPDVVIADHYIRRWHILPRNRLMNLYYHVYEGSDPGEDLHDHPWWNVSWILKSYFVETVPKYSKTDPYVSGAWPNSFEDKYRITQVLVRREGQIIFRKAEQSHLQIVPLPHCHSLFLTGPLRRKWGFWTKSGWEQYDVYLAKKTPRTQMESKHDAAY